MKLVEQLPLLVDQSLGIANEIDEQDMPNLELRLSWRAFSTIASALF
jgi:hypothetical protein